MVGSWHSFDELEKTISLPELMEVVNGVREQEERRQKFELALRGVDPDEGDESDFAKLKREVEEEQGTGISTDLAELGFAYEKVS